MGRDVMGNDRRHIIAPDKGVDKVDCELVVDARRGVGDVDLLGATHAVPAHVLEQGESQVGVDGVHDARSCHVLGLEDAYDELEM